ncbi:hypothetical protein PLCT2_00475 [Planctomycetaceae bacterium]|nr:hypothetical protein PLCT2_00475 [Planctomycetaceae bacterium]
METNVVDTTSGTIIIDDPSGAFAAALAEATGDPSHFAPAIQDFVIFAFNDSKVPNAPTYQTQGRPTGANLQNAPHFAGGATGPTTGSGKTKFPDAEADDNGGGFASWMEGCLLVPDVNIGAPLVIVNVPSATEVEVSGTATGVGSNGSRYLIYAAPFTDAAHGTLQTDAHKTGTRYLWAGYRYQPPQIGFWVNPGAGFGVYGAATGSNRLGQYYAWNRTYDINTGRWTTPDPVATPWWSLWEFVRNHPVTSSDASGLAVPAVVAAMAPCIIGALINLTQDAAVEWFLDSKFTACEVFFSIALGCVCGYLPGLGAAEDFIKKGLMKAIADFAVEMGFGIALGRACEGIYTPNEDSYGLGKLWDDILGGRPFRQVEKKIGEAMKKVGVDDAIDKGKRYVEDVDDSHERARQRRLKEKYGEPKSSPCPAPAPSIPAYDGRDAAEFFDPSTLQGPGITKKHCIDACKRAAGSARIHVEEMCAKSCQNFN